MNFSINDNYFFLLIYYKIGLSALNGSSFIAFILYVSIGSLGAMTMRNVTDNMLQSMMSGAFGTFTEISSMVFAFFIIGLGIPLFR